MGLINWFRRWRPSPRRTTVEFDENAVTCRRFGGLVESVRWDELKAVLIMTTGAGPLLDDVFWVLVGESGGCVVPSESAGADNLLLRLQKLPGFDNEALISAMRCTEDRKFLCWQRHDATDPSALP